MAGEWLSVAGGMMVRCGFAVVNPGLKGETHSTSLRAGSEAPGFVVGLLTVEDMPDFAFLAFGDVEGAVGGLSDAIGAGVGFGGVHEGGFAGESGGEDLVVSGGAAGD